MANTPLGIERDWEELTKDGSQITDEFWAVWETGFKLYFDRTEAIIKSVDSGGLSKEAAQQVSHLSEQMNRFIKNLNAYDGEVSKIINGQVYLSPRLFKLICHYIRNDLYIIVLCVDIDGSFEECVLFTDVQRIAKALEDMRNFWVKIKCLTK